MSERNEYATLILPAPNEIAKRGVLAVQQAMSSDGYRTRTLWGDVSLEATFLQGARTAFDVTRLILVGEKSNTDDISAAETALEALARDSYSNGVSIILAESVAEPWHQSLADSVRLTLHRGDERAHLWLPDQPNVSYPEPTITSGVILPDPEDENIRPPGRITHASPPRHNPTIRTQGEQ